MKLCSIVLLESNKTGPSGSAVSLFDSVGVGAHVCMPCTLQNGHVGLYGDHVASRVLRNAQFLRFVHMRREWVGDSKSSRMRPTMKVAGQGKGQSLESL
jgi:hypothetical protein